MLDSAASEHYRQPSLQRISLIITSVIQVLILTATVNIIMDSVPGLSPRIKRANYIVEFICSICFTLELGLRILACTQKHTDDPKILPSRSQFWTMQFTYIDIL